MQKPFFTNQRIIVDLADDPMINAQKVYAL